MQGKEISVLKYARNVIDKLMRYSRMEINKTAIAEKLGESRR